MIRAEVSASRVRLEGQLEVVEAAARSLERGIVLLAKNDPLGLVEIHRRAQSAETRSAEAAVRDMAGEDPSLFNSLKQLEHTRAQFAKAVGERQRRLKLGAMPLSEAIEAIADEPIRHATSPTRTTLLISAVVCVAALGSLLGVNATNRFAMAVALISGLVTTMSVYGWSNRALVTSKRLLIGQRVFPLAEIAIQKRALRGNAHTWAVCWSTGEGLGFDADLAVGEALRAEGVLVLPDPEPQRK